MEAEIISEIAVTIFNYVLKNFKAVYKIKSSEFDINYGINNSSRIQIRKGEISYFKGNKPLDLNTITRKEWNKTDIPFLFHSESAENILSVAEGRVVINYDIIASSFYYLSNWQEYVSQEKDKYGRFPFSQSIQYKLKTADIPVVNYYFDILKSAIEIGYNIKLNQNLWKGRNLAVCVTHDVDLCESAWIQGSYREIRRGNFLSPFKLLARKIFNDDEWFNFREIIETEHKYDINSTFFFLADDRVKDGIPNADYKITKPEFKKIFDLIEGNGSEIAIHGSIGTYQDADLLKSEMKKIGRNITGNRFHYLLYDSLNTPEILSGSGLKYDSSLYFAEAVGFRNSFCLPFYLFDIKNFYTTDIIEIPLTVMDTSFEERYMGLNHEDALTAMYGLVEKVEKFNGCFTLLWHNTCFSEYKYKGWKDVYCRFIRFALNKGAFISGGRNILDQFTAAD